MLGYSNRILLLDAGALLLMYALFFWAPDVPVFANRGVLGALIGLASIWLTLYLWMRVRQVAGDTRSLGEQQAGLGVFFFVAVAAFFFWRLHQLGWQTDLSDPATRAIGSNAISMLIGYWIVSGILAHQHAVLLGTRGEAMEDERDRDIRASASSHGYTFLIVAIIAVIIQLGFGGHYLPSKTLAFATPTNIAHWLIGALILSTLVEKTSALWQYHRSAVDSDEAAAS